MRKVKNEYEINFSLDVSLIFYFLRIELNIITQNDNILIPYLLATIAEKIPLAVGKTYIGVLVFS